MANKLTSDIQNIVTYSSMSVLEVRFVHVQVSMRRHIPQLDCNDFVIGNVHFLYNAKHS